MAKSTRKRFSKTKPKKDKKKFLPDFGTSVYKAIGGSEFTLQLFQPIRLEAVYADSVGRYQSSIVPVLYVVSPFIPSLTVGVPHMLTIEWSPIPVCRNGQENINVVADALLDEISLKARADWQYLDRSENLVIPCQVLLN